MQKVPLLLSLVVALGLFSCEREEDIVPNAINYLHEATSTHLITTEFIGSVNEQNSSTYASIPNGSGGFFFNGVQRSNTIVGSMASHGGREWSRTTDFVVRDIETYEANGRWYLIAVGSRDFDGDNASDEGIIAIFDDDGNKLDEVSILYDDFDVLLYTIEVPDNSNGVLFVRAAGSGRIDDVDYPYVLDFFVDRNAARIRVNSNDPFAFNLFQTLPNKRIVDMEGVSTSYMSYNIIQESGERAGYGVMKLEGLELLWDKPLSNDPIVEGFTTLHDGVVLDGNALYVAASERMEKPVLEDSDQTNWYGGKVYSLSLANGALNWETTLNYSDVGDFAKGIVVDDSDVIVIGEVARWSEVSQTPDLQLAYGSISILSKSTGREQSFHSFGSESYRQGFNNAYLDGNDLYLFGYTNFYHSEGEEGTFDRWMVKINKRDL